MLKRKFRLNLKRRPKVAESINLPFFTLKTAKNDLLYNRYGFIIPKKIDKRAVVRNRIKRMFHHCLENLLGEVQAGHDMLFFIKKGILDIQEDKLCVLLKDIFVQEGFLK